MTLETHGPRLGTKDAMQQGRGEGGLCQSKRSISQTWVSAEGILL